MNDSTICCICLEDAADTKLLCCHAQLHLFCVYKWIIRNQQHLPKDDNKGLIICSCPLCRHEFKASSTTSVSSASSSSSTALNNSSLAVPPTPLRAVPILRSPPVMHRSLHSRVVPVVSNTPSPLDQELRAHYLWLSAGENFLRRLLHYNFYHNINNNTDFFLRNCPSLMSVLIFMTTFWAMLLAVTLKAIKEDAFTPEQVGIAATFKCKNDTGTNVVLVLIESFLYTVAIMFLIATVSSHWK